MERINSPGNAVTQDPIYRLVSGAMQEAAEYCVDMAEIQAAASKIIAEATGAESGIVTSGAAAGLLLGTPSPVWRDSTRPKWRAYPTPPA